MRLLFKSALCLFVLFTNIFAASKFGGDQFKPDEVRVYKRVGDTDLSLHIFYPPEHNPSDSKPAIVFFFGGGWTGGTPTQHYAHAEYLSARGMVVLCAEYRVKKRNNTTPKECVMDGKSAIRWVKCEAEKLGVDPDKVLAGGGSAGGHIALATATLKKFDEEGEDTSVSCIPAALVLFNPVYDNSKKGYGYGRVKNYWKDISPAHNLSKKTPPSITFFGDDDRHHSVRTVRAFHAKAKSLGIRADLHLYKAQTHGFFNFGRSEYFNTTLIEADKFLHSLGYLKGEPELEKIPVFLSEEE